MVSRVPLIFLTNVFLLLSAAHLDADIIQLKSGKKIEANVVESNDRVVKVNIQGAVVSLDRSQVHSIDWADRSDENDLKTLMTTFHDYKSALDSGNWQKITTYLSSRAIQEIGAQTNRNDLIAQVQKNFPHRINVIKHNIKGSEALIFATSKLQGQAAQGIIVFRKEWGKWRIDREMWKAL